jgi:hypothetical protein
VNEKTRPPSTNYDERGVAELLRRASALDQKRKLARPTLTLQEVEETVWTRLAGAPLTHTVERVIDGELSTDDHEAVAAAIRTRGPTSSPRPT